MSNKTRQTIKEILSQRNYKIQEDEDDRIIGVNDDKQICVFTEVCSKFNIDRVKEYISYMHKMGQSHCIIIYGGSATPMAKKLVESSVEIEMELFTEQELQYNITKHRLVPTHIRISDDDAIIFKNTHGLNHPALLRTDPISRFYNYKLGDVIKIIRPGNFISYRIVKG